MTVSHPRRAALLAASFSLALTATVATAARAQEKPAPAPQSVRPAAPPAPAKVAGPKLPPVVKLPGNVVARVDGRDISRDELLAFVDMTHGGQYVDQLINNVLLQREAKRLNVVVTKEELAGRIQAIKDQVVQSQMMDKGTPMTFAQIAEREGFTDDLLRWSAYTEILRRKTMEKSLAEKIPSMDSQRRLAHILFTTIPQNATPGQPYQQPSAEEQKKLDDSAKSRLEALLEEIKSGKKTWEEAARQSDDQANASQGGDLGFVGLNQLDPAFEKAAFAIPKSGDIIGPIKSSFGWHLIKLTQKGSEASAQEKAAYRKQLLDQQMGNQQVMGAWLTELRRKAKIERNPVPKIVPGAVSPARIADNAKPGAKPTTKPAQAKPAQGTKPAPKPAS
jgi:parvulin-like peptidyl-prolyl isomerase